MCHPKRFIVLATFLGLFSVAGCIAPERAGATPDKAVETAAQRTAWFREAKFGMFIHWGPYSQASVEASWPIMTPGPNPAISEVEYRALPRRFNPVKFDAQAWIRLAKAAGQRYMVFTSKHHDGFCMFDSALTDYQITKTPYGRDIVAQLAAACREERMPLGFYYSPPDMNHPGFRDASKLAKENWQGEPERPEWTTYLDYMEGQLRELLTKYGPVALIWFDGLDHQEKYDGSRFHSLIHQLQPATLINNRIGLPGDFETPEQFVPDTIPTKSSRTRLAGLEHPKVPTGPAALPASPDDFLLWETCMTINDTWAYNQNDRNFKSATQLIRSLVEVASKGGNLLLNVGPTPEGTIQPEFEERLRAVGEWLRVNGESIYGTTYGPLQNLAFGRTTAKGKTIYLHVFEWPRGNMELSGLSRQVSEVRLLAGGKPLKYRRAGETLTIEVPAEPPDPHVSVLAIKTR
jgi:alpha-L-fucosidase